MPNIIKIIKLEHKTHKGKNILGNYGDTWGVIREKEQVLFSDKKGPWICCIPLKQPSVTKSRWIHLKNDTDFKVESQ